MFESPVRSGLLPLRAWTETETGPQKSGNCKKLDQTAKDQSKGVGLGLFAVTRPVLNQSRPVLLKYHVLFYSTTFYSEIHSGCIRPIHT